MTHLRSSVFPGSRGVPASAVIPAPTSHNKAGVSPGSRAAAARRGEVVCITTTEPSTVTYLRAASEPEPHG
jgi:hypothetical protein